VFLDQYQSSIACLSSSVDEKQGIVFVLVVGNQGTIRVVLSIRAAAGFAIDEKIRVAVEKQGTAVGNNAIVPVAEEIRSPTAVAIIAPKSTSTNATRTGLERELSMLRFSESFSTGATGIPASVL